jgi:tRNA A-37 threonylcarbamoyl transferase component Bud32
MNAPHTCPKCGSTLAPDAPEGLCPACLMAGGLPTDATIKLTPSQMRTPSSGPAAPSPEELAPLFPQLEILELLGRGGMGAVYKARQPKLNRFVALKIISGDAAADPHFAERFQREAQALAKLNHPHIVSVFDFGETGGLFYFLMEFVDGANLRSLMQSGEMKPEAALALIPSFCDALQYAHDEGVVHRDIKPENVLVDKKGRLKIADFGLAKLTGSDAHDHTLTRTGMYLGTPRYMAPEQVEKPETVDHRADIYSLGVVFYEMLTGELPMGRFDPPSKKVDVDVKLDDIVLRSLEKEPARRYQHASEIKTDVQGLGAVPAAQVLRQGAAVLPQPASSLPRHPGTLPSLICTGLGLLAAAVVFVLVSNVAWYWGLRADGEPDFPPRFRPFIFVCMPLGVLLSVTGTVWGWRVVRMIAASPQQWSGRGLAFAAASTVPLLVSNVLVIAAIDGVATFIGRLAQWDYTTIASLWSALAIPACVLVTWWLAIRLWRHLFGSGTKTTPLRQETKAPRLSRMALIGAIWALFGLIAVIPSMMLTQPVHLEEGRSSGLVYEQPPMAFTIFMAVLLFIGAGAPIGTTILGALSMNNIKRSAGKLYGLPLAFADVALFPMLLLHGAMAVMLGLLIVTIMKMVGVNAGLGAAEMGLLAMLPLIADFFIVRALWRKASGQCHANPPSITAPAVWMLVGAAASLIMVIFLVSETWRNHTNDLFTMAGTVARFSVLLVLAVLSGVSIRGALKMLQHEDHAGCRRAAVCSMFSVFGIISLPVGIWALVRLGRPEVKELFPQRPQETESPASSLPRPKRHLLSAFLVLLCLFGFFFGFSFQAKTGGTAVGVTEIITIGALDPLFVRERGPSGFQTSLNFFSWSFFAVVVCGIAFSALWRIGREDQGKVPRDPAWWRDWWKQVGIWGGLLLLACIVRTVMHPEKVLQPPSDRTDTIQNHFGKLFANGTPRIVAEKMGALEPEQYRFRYQIHTPPDHRVIVWMETTRNGKPVVIPGLANNISSSTQLGIGESFDGDAEFSLMEGSRITPDSKGKWRWDFKHGTVGKNSYRISPGGWIDNPFAGMGTSVHQGPKFWELKPGEEVSILVIRGGSHSYSRDPTEEPPAGEIELRLKARIDPVPLFHRVQGSVGSSLRDPFPTPSTPLGRMAAGFRIDPNLPEDEIRRQMIAELTNNDSKRLNAEMILKSVGKPVTHETKPEDVLKALEDVAQTVR